MNTSDLIRSVTSQQSANEKHDTTWNNSRTSKLVILYKQTTLLNGFDYAHKHGANLRRKHPAIHI